MKSEDEGVRYEADPLAPIRYEQFSRGAHFSSEAIADLRREYPRPSWWQRVRHEIGWRVPHAWRVLIHGDCDAY